MKGMPQMAAKKTFNVFLFYGLGNTIRAISGPTYCASLKIPDFWNLKCHSCDSPLFNYSLSKSIYGGDNVWRDPDMKNRATHICDANGENANILWLPSFWWPLNTKKAITRMLQKSIDLQSFTERSGQLWRSIKAMEVYFPSLGLKYPTPKSFLTSFQIHY